MVEKHFEVKTTITLYFYENARFPHKKGTILYIGDQKGFGKWVDGIIDDQWKGSKKNSWTLVFTTRMPLKGAKKFPEKVKGELNGIIQTRPFATVSRARVQIECEGEKEVFEV